MSPETANCERHATLRPRAAGRQTPGGAGGFTLIELILVMTLLTIAVGLAAPALANFFRGRSLDSEARRVLSLTRHGQSRAVSEGVPMDLWVDTAQGKFGLEAEPSYETEDPRAVEEALDPDMRLEAVTGENTGNTAALALAAATGQAGQAPRLSKRPQLPRIRFLPDGSMDELSPPSLRLTGRDGFAILITQTRNGLAYEIRTGNQ